MKTSMLEKFETLMAAVAFAEHNDHDYALKLVGSASHKENRNHARKNKGQRPESRPQMRV